MTEKDWVKAWNKFKQDIAEADEEKALELFFEYWREHGEEISKDYGQLWDGVTEAIYQTIQDIDITMDRYVEVNND